MYLSAPLAFQATLGGDPTISSIHEGLETINFVLIIDIYFEGEVRPIPSLGPWERDGPTSVSEANGTAATRWYGDMIECGGERAVQEASEEEGGQY